MEFGFEQAAATSSRDLMRTKALKKALSNYSLRGQEILTLDICTVKFWTPSTKTCKGSESLSSSSTALNPTRSTGSDEPSLSEEMAFRIQ